MYAVVLAGGGGTRLWPLSRPDRPKPFLRLLGERTLIQSSVARLSPLIEPRDIYVITDRRYLGLAAEQLPDIPGANLIGEPTGRNTAAAIALAAEAIDRPGDEVMLVLPADANILDEVGYRAALVAAAQVARDEGCLVTLGITPDRPETGYGYVLALPPAREVGGRPAFDVEKFVEKPTAKRAVELLATGLASWNAGIFLWTRDSIRERLMRHAADIAGPIRTICESGDLADLDAAYPHIRSTSIDYAVMEPASLEGAVSVVPMDVGWSDVGSWAALRDIWQAATAATATSRNGGDAGTVAGATPAAAGTTNAPADGTVGTGRWRDVGSSNTLVMAGDRLVVTMGLDGIVVVDTPDALLVCSAEMSQEVRRIAQELAEEKR